MKSKEIASIELNTEEKAKMYACITGGRYEKASRRDGKAIYKVHYKTTQIRKENENEEEV